MTGAMRTMLRELMGYRTGNVVHHPRRFSLIVSKADLRAAITLENEGIVRIVDRRAYRVVSTEEKR